MRRLILYPMLSVWAVMLVLTASAQQTNYPNTFLWRITGKDLKKPSYLYGTMHLQDRRIFQFSDSLYYFLEHTDGYAMEINPDDAFAALMKSFGQPDTTGFLKDAMNKKDFQKVATNLESQFGVPAEKVTRKQAWLYQQGFRNSSKIKPEDMDAAMDMYLFNIAKRQGKWVGGIEDVEDQFGLLNEMGAQYSGENLLESKNLQTAYLEKMIQQYRAQDLTKVHEWTTAMDSLNNDRMLVKRNNKMAWRMDSMAHIRSQFFAVGVAHLPGKEGLIALLTKAGYTLEPVITKKKIAPEAYHYTAVDLPWCKVEDEDKTFEASMPGKAVPFTPYGDILKMNVYADMGAGLYYFITSLPVSADKNKDSLLQHLAQNYARAGKQIAASRVSFKGLSGIESTTNTKGYYYRLRVLLNGNRVVIIMAGSQKKELLASSSVQRFYESLVVKPYEASANVAASWYRYSDEEKAFEVSFPFKPASNNSISEKTEQVNKSGWTITNQTSLDLAAQVYYMLLIKETQPGYFISSDDNIFEEMKNNLQQNSGLTLSHYQIGNIEENNCLWMNGSYKVNNTKLKSFHVNRGNRSYSLMAVYDKTSDTTGIQKFFNSFHFLPYQKTEWNVYADSLNRFSTQAPAPIKQQVAADDRAFNKYSVNSFDKQSGFSFSVEASPLSPYYQCATDSVFFADELAQILGAEDSLVASKKVINGSASGMEYWIRMHKDRRNYKKIRVLLNGDSLYLIYMVAPQQQHIADYDAFFSNFRFQHYKSHDDIFKNKVQRFLTDLKSTDSTVFANAKAYFDYVPFTKADLPYLHQALLEPYQDFEEAYSSVHDKILKKVIAFSDASSVDFIQQQYALLSGAKEELKYSLLNGLAGMKTAKAYTVLKSLLLQSLPQKGDPLNLAYRMGDSLKLAQTLYPEILTLSADSIFANVLAILSNQLLDSNAIQLTDLQPYTNNFLQHARHQFASLASSGEDDWTFGNWVYLLGKINNPESNSLLQQVTKTSSVYLNQLAVIALLKNNQPVDAAAIAAVAANQAYRVGFYEDLQKINKLSLFPVKFRTQKSMAESELYNYASDEADPSAIEFIGEQMTNYKGEKKKFYLYKVSYSNEDGGNETYLGVVGPYSLTTNKIITQSEVIGLSSDSYNPKVQEEQFSQLLKEQADSSTVSSD